MSQKKSEWARRGGRGVVVCGLVTVTNFCILSTLLGVWWRRRGVDPAMT